MLKLRLGVDLKDLIQDIVNKKRVFIYDMNPVSWT